MLVYSIFDVLSIRGTKLKHFLITQVDSKEKEVKNIILCRKLNANGTCLLSKANS